MCPISPLNPGASDYMTLRDRMTNREYLKVLANNRKYGRKFELANDEFNSMQALKDEKTRVKQLKALEEGISILIEEGQTVPDRLMNLLKKLRK